MKKCLRCEQVYGDDTNFCLSDGSALAPVADSAASYGETPTVLSSAPPTANFGAAPQFIPQAAAFDAPAQTTKKSGTFLIALVVGFFALLAGGAIVGVVMYGMNSGKKDEKYAVESNSPNNANKSAPPEQKSGNDNLSQNLKEQQEKLDQDKRKLEDERRKLEANKSTAATPAPTQAARTAVIVDPPSNIRAAPNGSVLCVARTRGTVVNITGATGVSDNNGSWYYTDYCGSRGVIHSSQIRF